MEPHHSPHAAESTVSRAGFLVMIFFLICFAVVVWKIRHDVNHRPSLERAEVRAMFEDTAYFQPNPGLARDASVGHFAGSPLVLEKSGEPLPAGPLIVAGRDDLKHFFVYRSEDPEFIRNPAGDLLYFVRTGPDSWLRLRAVSQEQPPNP